jgi:hypothetical protein
VNSDRKPSHRGVFAAMISAARNRIAGDSNLRMFKTFSGPPDVTIFVTIPGQLGKLGETANPYKPQKKRCLRFQRFLWISPEWIMSPLL